MNRTVLPAACSPEDAAELYVSARIGSGLPVSKADAVRALRAMLHDCALTDQELAALVAQAAVAQGLDIRFDGSGADQGYPRFTAPGDGAGKN